MNKIILGSLILIIILLNLNFVSAAEINIVEDIRTCILSNFDEHNFTKETTIFYYDNSSCSECSSYVASLDKDYQVFETTNYFSNVGPTLAICLYNFKILQSLDMVSLQNFVQECNDYKTPQRTYVTLDRSNDKDGDNPIIIFEDTGEIAGLNMTVYDLFGSDYKSIEEIQYDYENMTEIIENARKEYAQKIFDEQSKKAREEGDKLFQERKQLYEKEYACTQAKLEAEELYKTQVKQIEEFQKIGNKTIRINMTEEREKLKEQLFTGLENCSKYPEQLEAHKVQLNKNFDFVRKDPEGLNQSEGKYIEREKEFLGQYYNKDKKYILNKLNTLEIKVEKIDDIESKNRPVPFARFQEWIKDLLERIFG